VNLSISNKIEKNYAVITVAGEVDMYSSPNFRKNMMTILKKKFPVVITDLEDVSYMDSSGVATLIEALQMCKKYNGKLILCGLSDSVREVFELTRLDGIFQIFNDLESAISDL